MQTFVQVLSDLFGTPLHEGYAAYVLKNILDVFEGARIFEIKACIVPSSPWYLFASLIPIMQSFVALRWRMGHILPIVAPCNAAEFVVLLSLIDCGI